MLEKDIEAYLYKEVKKRGGVAWKFVSPGHDGVPDRIVSMPGGVQVYVELKAPGKHSTELQKKMQEELARLWQVVYYDVDSKETVNALLAALALAYFDRDGLHVPPMPGLLRREVIE